MHKSRLTKLVKNAKTGTYEPSINEVVFWYDALNEHIFDKDLPKLTGVQFCRTRFWGEMSCERYKNGKLRADLKLCLRFNSFKDFVEVLAHEMIHLWEFDNFHVMGHGERFFMWESKLKKFGLSLAISQ